MHLLVRRIVNVGRTLSLSPSLDGSRVGFVENIFAALIVNVSHQWLKLQRTSICIATLLPLIANGHGPPIPFHRHFNFSDRHLIFLLSGQRRRKERSGLGGGCRERGQFIFLQ